MDRTAVNRERQPSPRLFLLDGGGEKTALDQKQVIIGAEIEAYSIALSDYTIGRRTSRPRPGVSERGERFTRDTSIGSEYNSKPFTTTREALFLLKSGLRKYLRDLYRGETDDDERLVPLLVGGWTNRSAGTHLHISLAEQALNDDDVRALAEHIHDQIPLLLAISANSPVWDRRMTRFQSNRVLKGGDSYFAPLERGDVSTRDLQELRFSPGRKLKPPTLELRFLDSNLPEFVVASMVIVKAIVLRWLSNKGPVNVLDGEEYLRAREQAATKGMRTKLPWKGEWKPARTVLDRFLWEHRDELLAMDVPKEVWDTFKLLKRGYNGSRMVTEAIHAAKREHAQTWQRRFAKRYSEGLELLLNGNTIFDFAEAVHVPLPAIDNVWLGRAGATFYE
ncbi:MAG: hypothetical protein IT381_21005 [Deltaproteobacteria bacterium]|nr:hypothetical protein [Deltaproteobacteria bacterium]